MCLFKKLGIILIIICSNVSVIAEIQKRNAKYEWQNIKYGVGNTAPLPWQNISIKGKKILLTNKTISYSKSFLPDQITVNNAPLFERKPLISMEINGQTILGDDFKTKITQKNEGWVKLLSVFNNPKYKIEVISTVEFDGFIKTETTIIPKTNTAITIDKFLIDILYKKGVAKRFSKYLEYDFNSQRIKKSSFKGATGVIPRQDRYYSFTPSFWLGNENAGVEWVAETNHNYFLKSPKKTHKIYLSKNNVGFRTEIINKRTKTNKSFSYSFSFFVTPSKQDNKSLDKAYLTASMSPRRAVQINKRFPNMTMLFNGHWKGVPVESPALPLPPKNQIKKYQAIRKELENNNIKYMPYSTLYFLHSTLKEMQDYSLDWRSTDKRKGSKFWRDRIDSARPVQPVTLESETIQDYLLFQHIQHIEKHKTEGIYFDVSQFWDLKYTLQRFIAKKRILSPKKDLVYYPMYSHRTFLKRFWKASKKRNKDFMILHHTGSNIPKFALAYIDIVVIGESFHRLFSKNRLKTHTLNNKRSFLFPSKYIPDYFSISNDFLSGFKEKGVKYMLLPEVRRFNNDYLNANKDKYIKWSRSALAIAYEYDFSLWNTRIKTSALNNFYLALQEFSFYNKRHSKVNLNFEIKDKKTDSNSIFEKTIQRGNEYLMFFSNKSNHKVNIRMNSDSFNSNKFVHAYNAETQGSVSYTSEIIELTIPKKDYLLVKVITK